ncbi:MAG: Lrp/AsnC family transcriptional regulator [Methanomassiliicoccales archaeon]|jgi:Lrp/AsnC family transcriptional regulator, leucine-responsive regulatory protein|nr:Lrp/AsnC family transcriptional regulator [Methanomassiliicoccales archaeon]MDD1755497.1 Lrp/AsnC family transcriptional regulator [Methanomassiliicoccales archaeon]
MVRIDEMNKRILRLLMTDGKMTYNEVAQRMRRSPSTIRDRIRRMEDDKVILGYIALVSAERMGMKVEGVLMANLAEGASPDGLRALADVPGVLEVLQVSGSRRIMIRLNAKDNRSLEETIARDIVPLGLEDLELRIVLESVMRFPEV